MAVKCVQSEMLIWDASETVWETECVLGWLEVPTAVLLRMWRHVSVVDDVSSSTGNQLQDSNNCRVINL
jgi:hypothetical protein